MGKTRHLWGWQGLRRAEESQVGPGRLPLRDTSSLQGIQSHAPNTTHSGNIQPRVRLWPRTWPALPAPLLLQTSLMKSEGPQTRPGGSLSLVIPQGHALSASRVQERADIKGLSRSNKYRVESIQAWGAKDHGLCPPRLPHATFTVP